MRIKAKRIEKGIGFVRLIPTDDEDLWHIYNLVSVGDIVEAVTMRKVVSQTETGFKKVYLKRLRLRLLIVKVGYFANEDRLVLELKGKNTQENQYVKLNQFHRIDIQLNRQLTIIKDNWDGLHLAKLRELSNPTHDTDLVAMVMEEGIAHLCYIKTSLTYIKQKVMKHIPQKRSGQDVHTKYMDSFFNECMTALFTVDFEKIKCCIIASPGFVKEQFVQYLKEMLQKEEYLQFRQNGILEKLLLLTCSSGYKNSLTEVLADQSVQERLKDTQAIKEVTILDEFYQTLTKNSDQVAYGFKHVKIAFQSQAIAKLLISDKLFQTMDLDQRKEYIKFIENVKQNGGEVHIFSSMHSSGEKLDSLTGIAAILRYPLVIDEEMDDQIDPSTENSEINDEEEEKQGDGQKDSPSQSQPTQQISQDILDWLNEAEGDEEFYDDEIIKITPQSSEDSPTQLQKSQQNESQSDKQKQQNEDQQQNDPQAKNNDTKDKNKKKQ